MCSAPTFPASPSTTPAAFRTGAHRAGRHARPTDAAPVSPTPRATLRSAAPRAGRHARPTDEVAVARLMAAIAAGDTAAIWELRELADEPVRARVRGELRRLELRYDADDLDGMVIDAVLAIVDVAGAWRPGGAPPWSWAHHRVIGVVHRFAGTFADSLDEAGEGDADGALGRLGVRTGGTGGGDTASSPTEVIADTRAVLERLAAVHPPVAALDAALTLLASARDAALWLAVLDERGAGNHSPAVTVGARFAMRPAAVRKAVQRVWARLLDPVANPQLAAIESLQLVADRQAPAA